MRNKLAQLVSVLFHPLLMPSLVFGILYFYAPELLSPINENAIIYIFLAIFITTFLIPVVSVTALRMTNTISSFSLFNRNERIIPFVFISVFYGITAYMFLSKLRVSDVFVVIMLGTTALVFGLTLITLFWKISVHSAGVSGATGFILALLLKNPSTELFNPLLFMILCSGMVMTARLQLNAHRPSEVSGGLLVGLAFSLTSIVFFT